MATKPPLNPKKKPGRQPDGAPLVPLASAVPAVPSPPDAASQVAFPQALNKTQSERKASKYQIAATAMRRELWPEVPDQELWLIGAREKKGFCQIPRVLPLLINIINDASKKVGKARAVPAGRAYLVLWCRDFGQAVVRVDNETVAASEAGYSGERSVSTWREHLRVLEELGFIRTEGGSAGPAQWVLLMNPFNVALNLKQKGWVQKGAYASLLQRTLEVGGGAEMAQ